MRKKKNLTAFVITCCLLLAGGVFAFLTDSFNFDHVITTGNVGVEIDASAMDDYLQNEYPFK